MRPARLRNGSGTAAAVSTGPGRGEPSGPALVPPGVRRRLLAGCDEAQVEAITSDRSPLCIVAPAGSGKTRVLTRRIAWRVAAGDAASGHVLALTFTRKAAGELRGRLAALGVPAGTAAGTFHAVAFAQLSQLAADRGRTPPAILDSKIRLLADLTGPRHGRTRGGRPARSREAGQSFGDRSSSGGADGRRRGGSQRGMLAEAATEIEWAKARLVGPDSYEAAASAALRSPPIGFADMAELFRSYESERRRRGLYDFEDLLTALTREINTDPDVAAVQRWRFRHVFVDEFQDVNPSQLRLLEAWVGDRDDLCVVGDPHQAIYSWNGADPAIMHSLPVRWPAIGVLQLATNYRSTPQVLALAAAALGTGDGDAGASRGGVTGGGSVSGAGPGRGPAMPTRHVRADRADGAVPTISTYPNDLAEASAVAAGLRRAHSPGRRWSQLAVLARTNNQLVLFERACAAAGVPFRVAGDQSFLQRPAVSEFLTLVGRASGASPEAFRRHVADVEAAAAAASPVPAGTDSDDAATASDPLDGPTATTGGDDEQAESRALDLAALARLCRDYEAIDPAGGGAGFAAWLRTALRGEPSAGDSDAVELTTFHRAKGLEWPVVFVTGLERGLVPIAQAGAGEPLAEERRLLYVALTRAEDELHCTWARERRWGTTLARREPSPWLPAIEAARRGLLAGRPGSADARHAAISAGRSALAGGSAELPVEGAALDGAIREWRAGRAKAANVPAYVVMPDRTLDAIVRARPQSVDELLALPGIGPSRAAAYGDPILALVRHASQA